MAKPGVQWITPPSVLAKNIEQYGDRAIQAIYALAQFIATKAQNEMRQNAPWEDRTGNARSGLFSVAELARDIVTIYLSHGHTVDYGIYLELDHGGKYAIILPTMEKLYPEINRLLDKLLKD